MYLQANEDGKVTGPSEKNLQWCAAKVIEERIGRSDAFFRTQAKVCDLETNGKKTSRDFVCLSDEVKTYTNIELISFTPWTVSEENIF